MYISPFINYLLSYSLKKEYFRKGVTHYFIVGENIIATIKMRINFWYPFKMVIFPILRQQDLYFSLLIPIQSSLFQLCDGKSCRSCLLNFLSLFWTFVHGFFSLLSFYSFCTSNYCDSNSCRSFTLLKALAKSKSTHIAIAFKSQKEQ